MARLVGFVAGNSMTILFLHGWRSIPGGVKSTYLAEHGHTAINPALGEKEFAMIAVQVSLAGPVAEMIYSGDPYHPALIAEWAADWREAWDAAVPLHPDERQRLEYLEQVSIQLYHRLKADDLWSALASLADHLLAHETLEGEEVAEIVGEWIQ